ncbi:MAG: immunoglobulin domain-containing protein [Verrucomicrobia bacterium]|nr:immunoglobulin domain-containing protein [Verrucomicrobiota bacterium]
MNIVGATSASYTIDSAKKTDAGNYTVTVSNSAGSVTSSAAKLTVNLKKPTISTQPKSQTVTEGNDVTFTVTANGSELSYQWYMDGSPINGATSASYKLTNVRPSYAGNYTVKVSNSAGSVTSSAAKLTVNLKKPTISTQPKSQTVTEGDYVTLTVTASGSELSYQWYKDGNLINGATSASYKITNVIPSHAGSYTVTVNNSAGRVTSSAAVLTVKLKMPVITMQPTNLTVLKGSSATFTVQANGTDMSYQWYKDGNPISGATKTSYTIGSVSENSVGSYTVTVSNSTGSVTSETAVLTLKKDEVSVQREVSVIGNKATVTLTISNAPKGYFGSLEENWQSKILTFSGISNDGTAAETENGMKVSWSGFDMGGNYQFPGTLTYTATVPEGTSATVTLSGQLVITTSNGAVSADIAVQNVTFTAAPSAPVITAQPQSQTVSEGGSVTFSVTATGSAPLLYQWMKDGAVISGATGSSYTIGSVKPSDAGTYVVMIMNAQGAVMSSPATLTLAQQGAPELKLEPAGTGKWKITFTGTLQESTDTKTWKNVSGTQGGTYTFSPASGKKFFRAAK